MPYTKTITFDIQSPDFSGWKIDIVMTIEDEVPLRALTADTMYAKNLEFVVVGGHRPFLERAVICDTETNLEWFWRFDGKNVHEHQFFTDEHFTHVRYIEGNKMFYGKMLEE